MVPDLFKYIFDESIKDGCKGIISVIIKITAFFICLSPVFIYFLLYQPSVVKDYNIFISSTLILGCGCLLFFLIFLSSKVYSSMLLTEKIKANNKLTIEEKEHYYFEKSFVITTIFQGILSILLIISFYYNNPSKFNTNQINDFIIVLIVIIVFITISFGFWINSLLKYIDNLEKENEYLTSYKIKHNTEINTKENEKIINDILTLLEDYKHDASV